MDSLKCNDLFTTFTAHIPSSSQIEVHVERGRELNKELAGGRP